MITLHHLNNSRSQRVLWLLEELEIPYGLERYQRDPKTMQAPEALRAVHPLGKAPILTDEGHTVAETGAIVEYILSRHGGGRMIPPADSDNHLAYTYWLHFAEGSAMPPLVMDIVLQEMPKRITPLIRPLARLIGQGMRTGYLKPMIDSHLDLMETTLTGGGWFAGATLTAADVMMSFPVEAAAARGGLGSRRALAAWLAKVHARPAFKRALEKGGPYAYA
ncbi:glutathione S-transferase [Rhodospirillum rubrum]|uniref:glutathione S-transferase family protein n=1 Tax=Rhodospirillum rubrum TaxID=1085 RepID=UPI001903371F|nr:glutathione S-transferase [Rhodospirillum rubrum]MBK1663529.1 glutathione S-transferase [Rhodospirillum rubrum]MBK1677297.1 glutathione S-transferase [Rhodospirillum rubrum]